MTFDKHPIPQIQVTIEPEVMKNILHEVKHGKPLSEDALSALHIIQSAIPCGLPKPVYDHLLIEWLANRIRHNLNTIRHAHNLPSSQSTDGRDTVLEQLQLDFSQEDIRLEAWSILYLSFIRVDIRITDKALTKIALVSPRTLRRRRQRGYELLLIDIIMEEINLKQ